jgi:hypothetical protein
VETDVLFPRTKERLMNSYFVPELTYRRGLLTCLHFSVSIELSLKSLAVDITTADARHIFQQLPKMH